MSCCFSPPYSLNFNPIETAFSTIKSWIRRNRDFMEACNDPIYTLLVACSQITLQMAKLYFEESLRSLLLLFYFCYKFLKLS